MNWKEFINGMMTIRAKTLKDKIDLFIKLADQDGNNSLSWDEVYSLAKICLSRFIDESKNNSFLDSLSVYFTKLIFQTCKIDFNEDIPLSTVKEIILSVFLPSGFDLSFSSCFLVVCSSFFGFNGNRETQMLIWFACFAEQTFRGN